MAERVGLLGPSGAQPCGLAALSRHRSRRWRAGAEVQVARIEYRRLAGEAPQHRRLEVVDHDALRSQTAEKLEGMLVAGEKLLHLLRR
jgi:hypothetical protein